MYLETKVGNKVEVVAIPGRDATWEDAGQKGSVVLRITEQRNEKNYLNAFMSVKMLDDLIVLLEYNKQIALGNIPAPDLF